MPTLHDHLKQAKKERNEFKERLEYFNTLFRSLSGYANILEDLMVASYPEAIKYISDNLDDPKVKPINVLMVAMRPNPKTPINLAPTHEQLDAAIKEVSNVSVQTEATNHAGNG